MFMSITAFQKLVAVSIWMFNNLSTAVLTYKLVYKTLNCVRYHGKGKDIIVVFVNFLYNHFDDPEVVVR